MKNQVAVGAERLSGHHTSSLLRRVEKCISKKGKIKDENKDNIGSRSIECRIMGGFYTRVSNARQHEAGCTVEVLKTLTY
jgi:hypothetical protein